VLREPGLKFVLALHFVCYGTVISIVGLWAGPYLEDVHGLDPIRRGNVLLIAITAVTVGHLLWGPLDRRLDSRKRVASLAALATTAVLAALAAIPSPPLWLATLLLVLLGLAGTYNSVLTSHGRALFPDRLVGRAITTVNVAMMLGAFALQAVSGLVVDGFPTVDGHLPDIAYRALFASLAVMTGLGLLVYRGAPDRRPSEDAQRQFV
jgi:MFS family permease